MKMHVIGSMAVLSGVLLVFGAGCKEKPVPVDGEGVKQAAPAVEHPATTPPAADMPKDHPAH